MADSKLFAPPWEMFAYLVMDEKETLHLSLGRGSFTRVSWTVSLTDVHVAHGLVTSPIRAEMKNC